MRESEGPEVNFAAWSGWEDCPFWSLCYQLQNTQPQERQTIPRTLIKGASVILPSYEDRVSGSEWALAKTLQACSVLNLERSVTPTSGLPK